MADFGVVSSNDCLKKTARLLREPVGILLNLTNYFIFQQQLSDDVQIGSSNGHSSISTN